MDDFERDEWRDNELRQIHEDVEWLKVLFAEDEILAGANVDPVRWAHRETERVVSEAGFKISEIRRRAGLTAVSHVRVEF